MQGKGEKSAKRMTFDIVGFRLRMRSLKKKMSLLRRLLHLSKEKITPPIGYCDYYTYEYIVQNYGVDLKAEFIKWKTKLGVGNYIILVSPNATYIDAQGFSESARYYLIEDGKLIANFGKVRYDFTNTCRVRLLLVVNNNKYARMKYLFPIAAYKPVETTIEWMAQSCNELLNVFADELPNIIISCEFDKCTGLKGALSLPNNFKSIGSYSMRGNAITQINYDGTSQEWEAVTKLSNWGDKKVVCLRD